MTVIQPWTPDVPLDERVATILLESQFPDLAPVTLVHLGAGWDNTAWVVNGTWVFRFPHSRRTVVYMETELRHLPALAPHLPLPVTAATLVGRATMDYPYPFAGYPMLAGTPAADLCDVLEDASRARAAAPLGRFLGRLHSLPAADAPPDPIGRETLEKTAEKFRIAMDRVESVLGPVPGSGPLRERVTALAETGPRTGGPRWVHGDLHPHHLLVDGDGVPTGIIDWGDMHGGDPAVDLSIGWTWLPAAARGAFLDAYGPVDADTLARAELRSLFYGAVLWDSGLQRPHPGDAKVGRDILRRAAG